MGSASSSSNTALSQLQVHQHRGRGLLHGSDRAVVLSNCMTICALDSRSLLRNTCSEIKIARGSINVHGEGRSTQKKPLALRV